MHSPESCLSTLPQPHPKTWWVCTARACAWEHERYWHPTPAPSVYRWVKFECVWVHRWVKNGVKGWVHRWINSECADEFLTLWKTYWLVVWNIFYFSTYILEIITPNWLIFFRGVETTNRPRPRFVCRSPQVLDVFELHVVEHQNDALEIRWT